VNPIGVRLSGECPKCGSDIVVRRRRVDGSRFVSCVGYPECRWAGDYDEALERIADQLTDLRDEVKRLRAREPSAGPDLSRALLGIIRLAHPDKWQGASAKQLAHEVTTRLNELREKLK
jgi:hypothetical protein